MKPVVQAELGRYTIASGETGPRGARTACPGPRLGVSWLLWAWALMVLTSLVQVGGMFGGLAQLMNLLRARGAGVGCGCSCFVALTLALLLGGGYERIERLALVKVGFFTLLTVLAALVLTRMAEQFSWARVGRGPAPDAPGQPASPRPSPSSASPASGGTELFMYPYWCVEKGYARFVGRRDGQRRVARARARLDPADARRTSLLSMVVYTIATVAFYLLGAGVLHGIGPRARRRAT